MEQAVDNPISRSRLPDTVHVRRIQDRAISRVVTEDGEVLLYDPRDDSLARVFPLNWSVFDLLLGNHTLDRGSVGASGANFMESHGYLNTFHPGRFHDDWNSIKNSAKKSTSSGIWWARIVEFASLCNMNHGPYRSSAWRRLKEMLLGKYLETHDVNSPDFRVTAEETAKIDGKIISAPSEYVHYWRFMELLPSCHEAGPILKFARWMCISDCWQYYRREMWMLKAVLNENTTEIADAAVDYESTAMLDAQVARTMTTSKKGLLARAPTYVTWKLIDTMDLFCLITQPSRAEYTFRTTQVKTLKAGTSYGIKLASGYWQEEFRSTVEAATANLVKLEQYHCFDDSERGRTNSSQATAFTLELLTQKACRIMPSTLEYPYVSVGCLAASAQRARTSRVQIINDGIVVVAADHDILHGKHPALQYVVDDISWWDHDTVRLLFSIAEHERRSDTAPQTTHVCRAFTSRLLDEKPPEDVHQHIRDKQRQRRHRNITFARIFDTQVHSGVLEARGVKHPVVDRKELAHAAWQALTHQEKTAINYYPSPKDWPACMNGILNPHRTWPSPTVPTHANSYLAWHWLCTWTRVYKRGGTVSPIASWHSRLVQKHSVVTKLDTGESFICLFPGKWGYYWIGGGRVIWHCVAF